jgi:hypothetical protein
LEKAEFEGKEIKTNVQYTITPMIYEQINIIETLLTNVEMVSFHLTSKKSNTAISHVPPSHHSSYSTTSENYLLDNDNAGRRRTPSSTASSSPHLIGGGGENGRDLIDFNRNDSNNGHLEGSGGTINTSSHLKKALPLQAQGLSAISEALNMIESLRLDLEKMQMGIQLLTLSVTKLTDIVTTQPGCCTTILEMLSLTSFIPSGGGSSTLNPSSFHSTTSLSRIGINRNLSGNYNTHTNNILHSAAQLSKSDSNEHGESGKIANKKPFGSFGVGGSQYRKKGYENISTSSGRNNVFSIEGVDEYDD